MCGGLCSAQATRRTICFVINNATIAARSSLARSLVRFSRRGWSAKLTIITHFLYLEALSDGFPPNCGRLERLLHFDLGHFLCFTILTSQDPMGIFFTSFWVDFYVTFFPSQIIFSFLIFFFSSPPHTRKITRRTLSLATRNQFHEINSSTWLPRFACPDRLSIFNFYFHLRSVWNFTVELELFTKNPKAEEKLFNEFSTLQNSCLNYIAAAHSCSQAVGNWHENGKFSQFFFGLKKIVSFFFWEKAGASL